ncbi:DUF4139 domain-containing protein [Wohlfahrtiimonas sp. G9077]|uniref:DUF4139 domain-containing protein n=1 Tax=Wohlfahrtiimonas sp. G9077 TaxID=1980118 RepID=UPI000B97DD04|nr:DUF4139 domain-containing protein [Wohlfahrtiimonas sp. G9077]OYQ74416.1 DUF4139 domain-containing protein [Wohlfahrtiimonas sp. G9077]
MRRLKSAPLAAMVLLSTAAFANSSVIISQDQQREGLSITIYNDALALINDTRTLPMDTGLNRVEMQHVSAQIRPETALLTSLSGMPFNVIEQNFDYDLLSPQTLLDKSVGQTIEVITRDPQTGKTTREKATLLSNNGQPIVQFADRIEVGHLDNFAFPSLPTNLRSHPTLSMVLNSEQAGNNTVQLTYLSGGFSWRADYTATLSSDETFVDLSGLITLNNQSGTTFKNANLQLVAGDIHQVQQNIMRPMYKSAMPVAMMEMDTMPQSEAFSDYHLYQIPFKTDLNNQQTKQVALLNANHVPVQKIYQFNQYFDATTAEDDNLKASILYRFKNSQENHLGMPLPKGIVRIYKNDSSGNALLVGEDHIAHTAENEVFKVATGQAFDVSLTKKRTKVTKISKETTQYSYEVVFNNAKDEAVTVDYRDFIPFTSWQVTAASIAVTTQGSDQANWQIIVPAKAQQALTYTLQVTQ